MFLADGRESNCTAQSFSSQEDFLLANLFFFVNVNSFPFVCMPLSFGDSQLLLLNRTPLLHHR